jgi:hypothetical protein
VNIFNYGLERQDDVMLGALVNFHGANITEVSEFHSHLENMISLNEESFKDQVSFGYTYKNTVSVSKVKKNDPTRMISLHCSLFPDFEICNKDRIL